MYFVKKEDLDTIKDSKDFDEFIEGLRCLHEEGKVEVINMTGKTNIGIIMGQKLIEEGYEQIHFEIG